MRTTRLSLAGHQMRKALIVLACSVGFATIATDASAARCNGSACGEVDVYYEGGCFKMQNHSNQTVKVTLGAVTYTVRRGQTKTATNPFGGQCLQSFMGGVKAVYQ